MEVVWGGLGVFTRENLFAAGLCLIAIALLIVTSDSSPQWIYQGF